MKQIDGGVCAANGYTAAGVFCGIRKNKNKKDLALIYSEVKAACACVYTQNLVQGAPIAVTRSGTPRWRVAATTASRGGAMASASVKTSSSKPCCTRWCSSSTEAYRQSTVLACTKSPTCPLAALHKS